jgi:tetratricopeptide (TPR) repeat protein
MTRRSNESPAPGLEPNRLQAVIQALDHHLNRTEPVPEQMARQAQQLVYTAWKATTTAQGEALIRRALELDPTNVDALLQMGGYAGLTGEDKIEWMRKTVRMGEKNLGPELLDGYAGAFWVALQTRPYMRARQQLAEALTVAGRLEEAVAEYQALLSLNPDDHQRVRYPQLLLLLRLQRLAEARKLFREYPDDLTAQVVFSWGRVLERFLADDRATAATALTAARKRNPHLADYLLGRRPLPEKRPEVYTPGSPEEAVSFAESLHAIWAVHPAALDWLAAQKGA